MGVVCDSKATGIRSTENLRFCCTRWYLNSACVLVCHQTSVLLQWLTRRFQFPNICRIYCHPSFLMKMHARVVQLQTTVNLTGTKVTSSQPVVVLSGTQWTSITHTAHHFGSHIVEQMIPTSLWSQWFLMLPVTARLQGDRLRLLGLSYRFISHISLHLHTSSRKLFETA
jgi:hypothetical protein